MLSQYAKVDPDTGKYSKSENPNVVYGSLTHVSFQLRNKWFVANRRLQRLVQAS